MGDGNHSLATAKEYYEELKRENPDKDFSNHPARYALAEIVNLHSDALEFEAIHRIIEGVDTEDMLAEMTDELGLSENGTASQSFVWVCGSTEKKYYITKPTSNLTVGSVQNFIDKYLSANGGKVDYIHGAGIVRQLASKRAAQACCSPIWARTSFSPQSSRTAHCPERPSPWVMRRISAIMWKQER